MFIDKYSMCKCGHLENLHRERFLATFSVPETRKCGDLNSPKSVCFCRDYQFSSFQYHLDKYSILNLVRFAGKATMVIFMLVLALLSLTTFLFLGTALVVAIPVFLSSLFQKH